MSEDLQQLPPLDDLWSRLKFDSENGRIWLADERMILLRGSEMGALRRELIESLGMPRAKSLCMRMGYLFGRKDAEVAGKLRPDGPYFDTFLVGPQSQMVTGQAKVIPEMWQLEEGPDNFHSIFVWENSFEADVFKSEFGTSSEPVCWTQIGYATGYTSQFLGRPVIFKEISCAGCGDASCRVEGKPAEAWEDSEEILGYYQPDRIADQLLELQSQVSNLRDSLTDERQLEGLVGDSPKFVRAREMLSKAIDSKVTVLLLGETGVGKDKFAKALHQGSSRRDKPFIAVNCAAIPKDLIEAELFGVEKGAYTGAEHSRPGRFERADGGTLFLDEVGELSAQAQAALLRVLQERELERVGDTRTRKVDVRMVAATNENLDKAVAEGRFRADLLYRLNVYSVTVPPLRERTEDIPQLVAHFIDKYASVNGKQVRGVSDKAMAALLRYSWPGNIRELANVIERGLILAGQQTFIEDTHLFPHINAANDVTQFDSGAMPVMSLEFLVDNLLEQQWDLNQLEESYIRRALEKNGGNVTRAAKLLGVSRATLDYRVKKAAIPVAAPGRPAKL